MCYLFITNVSRNGKKIYWGKISHKKCWEQIVKIMKDKGYNITGPQCSSKLRSLKKTYKSIKDHNAKSGNERRIWQHYEIMEEIFSKKAWCNPVTLASSTGLSVKNTDNENSTASSSEMSYTSDLSLLNDDLVNKENISSNTKTSRQSTTGLLQKRLAQKETHEQKRQKRHEQRMEMEQKLIDTLAQYLNK
ncbi:uncharacterized protein [Mycetomoellerius zeteki]|uniref:uncharacterized protein n=1 Tax=Mycetomoellerius zeteki TaxID=64791 RepID=UPI00084EAF7A|nr:PREDICTED: uncharacterized protein LOC108720181 [Trachymyrmex zeteki]